MQEKLLYPINDAARMLSISRAKLYQLIARGEVKPVYIGRRVLIAAAELERYVRELQSTVWMS